jgi:hypothetical protein
MVYANQGSVELPPSIAGPFPFADEDMMIQGEY